MSTKTSPAGQWAGGVKHRVNLRHSVGAFSLARRRAAGGGGAVLRLRLVLVRRLLAQAVLQSVRLDCQGVAFHLHWRTRHLWLSRHALLQDDSHCNVLRPLAHDRGQGNLRLEDVDKWHPGSRDP